MAGTEDILRVTFLEWRDINDVGGWVRNPLEDEVLSTVILQVLGEKRHGVFLEARRAGRRLKVSIVPESLVRDE